MNTADSWKGKLFVNHSELTGRTIVVTGAGEVLHCELAKNEDPLECYHFWQLILGNFGIEYRYIDVPEEVHEAFENSDDLDIYTEFFKNYVREEIE